MGKSIKKLIEQKDFDGLRSKLAGNSELAQEGITIPFELFCKRKAHPLHRLCDAVFSGKMTEEEAIKIATIFLEFGSDINGFNDGSPLIAAASLHAEQLGIFYIDNGANIHFTDIIDNASALHWASFCGREKLVSKLIQAHAEINNPDSTYHSTPLGWAIHNLSIDNSGNRHNQIDCIKLLLQAGADINKLNEHAKKIFYAIAESDAELRNILPQA